jgi:hypothetical protein
MVASCALKPALMSYPVLWTVRDWLGCKPLVSTTLALGSGIALTQRDTRLD